VGANIEFFIPVKVLPKQSARFGKGHARRDPRIDANAKALAAYAMQYKPAAPLEWALRVHLTFHHSWTCRHSARTQRAGRQWKATRPDLDNLAKQVLDVLESAGFYDDDGQIADLHLRDFYADDDGVQVLIEELPIAGLDGGTK